MNYLYSQACVGRIFLALVMPLLVAACSQGSDGLPDAVSDDGMVSADWLLYQEEEQGTGQYPVRILVTQDFVRFDDNDDAGDFLLLDRRSRTLFSVSREERSILVIDNTPRDARLPPYVVLTEERDEDESAPRIAGKSPVHVRFNANDELCYEAVVIPGLLEGAAAALAEYARILGLRQLDSLDAVPIEMQTPCFLSRYAYSPERHLLEGMPVREWDNAGYLRTLVDYGEKQKFPGSLFVLPEGYGQFRIN